MWAYAKTPSYRRACRDILNKEKFYKKEAMLLQKEILKNFDASIIHKQFVDAVLGVDTNPLETQGEEGTVLEF